MDKLKELMHLRAALIDQARDMVQSQGADAMQRIGYIRTQVEGLDAHIAREQQLEDQFRRDCLAACQTPG